VLALAPDTSSRKSGGRLAAPGPWSEAGAGDDAVWGLCRGSGKKPYRTAVDLACGDAPGYRCSCPSRKFPCKHALGLLLLWAGGDPAVREPERAPDWAGEWLGERRTRAATRSGAGDGAVASGAAAPSGEAGAGAGRTAADPGAARRRADRRAAAVAAGAAELEQRLVDLLRGGLAGADADGYGSWEETAARMVDAQAPGLASRIRALGAIASSGPGWPERLLSECALLHLLAKAYLSVDTLPEGLAATVRARVGLPVESAAVLADADTRVRDDWLVLAQRDTDEGRLTARRIWLYGRASGRHALLLGFGAPGRAPQPTLPVGAALDADLAFYPGARPLRAALGERYGPPAAGFFPGRGAGATDAEGPRAAGTSAQQALATYGAALCDDPWLDGWPVVLTDVVPVPDADGWQLADASGEAALPVAPSVPAARLWRLASVSGGGPVTVFGECGHRGVVPHTVWSGAEASAAEL
jgi:hypothetical protein